MDLMKKPSQKLRMNVKSLAWSAFPIVAFAAALSGCGGATSNNLADPTANDGSKIVSCSASGAALCVTGQFIVDAPVAGLNYQCGTVNDLTDSTGTVSCPDQSIATFFLLSADKTKKITLGSYLVKSKRDIGRNASNTLVSITPLDLVVGALDAPSLMDPKAATAVGIAQILETLRSTSSPYTVNSPTSRLIISDDTKLKLNLLTGNIAATDITNGDFSTKLQPVLASLNLVLLPKSDTILRFNQALQAIQAGSYYTNPAFISSLPNVNLETASNVATIATLNTSINNQAVIGLNTIIDRSGNTIGQGAEWNGDISTADPSSLHPTALNLLLGPSGYTRLLLNNDQSFMNPLNGFVNNNFVWQPKEFNLDSNYIWQPVVPSTTSLGVATFSKGRLLGGTYIVGNNTLWQNVTNSPSTVTAPVDELGVWTQNNSNAIYNGTLSLQKSRSVDTFLDPTVFKTADNVGLGNQAIFPLHAILTFNYSDTTCTASNVYCKVLGTQGITILANGNIVTDMNQNCNSPAVQQYPIGLVGAAFQGLTNVTDRFISPIILLSGQQFGRLDGVQLGTIIFSNSVKINIAGALNGNLNISDNTNVTAKDSNGNITILTTGEQSTSPATYTNFYDIWSGIKTAPTTADVVVARRSVGTVTIKLNTSCYTPPIGH